MTKLNLSGIGRTQNKLYFQYKNIGGVKYAKTYPELTLHESIFTLSVVVRCNYQHPTSIVGA